nr:MAG TPA: tax1-binding protein [Caudoviricetes sp.]
MAIERFADAYTPTCDMCSAELPEEFSFEDAVDSKKQNGWRSVRDTGGDW